MVAPGLASGICTVIFAKKGSYEFRLSICISTAARHCSSKFSTQVALVTCPCAFWMLMQTSCQETSYKELVQRSCQEASYGELVQRSCQETSYRDLANRALRENLYRDIASRPLMEILSRDLVKRAEVLLRDPVTENLSRRSCARASSEIFTKRTCRI